MSNRLPAETGSVLRRDTPAPWIWSQRWSDLLFLHWRVPARSLQHRLPPGVEVEECEGAAWVSLVLFRLKVRPRWLPFVPGLSALTEANLRTYVRAEGKSGIYFLSIVADNGLSVRLARLLTPLPYRVARMSYRREQDAFRFERSGNGPRIAGMMTSWFQVTPSSNRGGKFPNLPNGPWGIGKLGNLPPRRSSDTEVGLTLEFRPSPSRRVPAGDSLDAWLLERYRAFAWRDRDGLMAAEVVHPPWDVGNVELLRAPLAGDSWWSGVPSCPPDAMHYAEGMDARFGAFRLVERAE